MCGPAAVCGRAGFQVVYVGLGSGVGGLGLLGGRVAGLSGGGLLGERPELLARICPRHPHLAVEAAYAVQSEMAVCLADFLFRRTRIAHGECRGLDCAEVAAAAMGSAAGWSAARCADEVAAYRREARALTEPAGRE